MLTDYQIQVSYRAVHLIRQRYSGASWLGASKASIMAQLPLLITPTSITPKTAVCHDISWIQDDEQDYSDLVRQSRLPSRQHQPLGFARYMGTASRAGWILGRRLP